MAASVLIVGAGPAGLVAALALSKSGVSVRIIDKGIPMVNVPKGAGIHPRTLELHHILGILPDILERARVVPEMNIYGPDGRTPVVVKRMAEFREPSPDIPWPNSHLLWQSVHEEILREHLKKHGIEVEWKTSLKCFEDSEDRVTTQLVKSTGGPDEVTEVASFRYLIGADGAHSIVRKNLGLSFLGEVTPYRAIVGSVQAEGLPTDRWHIWANPQKQMITLAFNTDPKASPNTFSAIIGGKVLDERFLAGRDEFVAAFVEHTGRTDIGFSHNLWTSAFLPQIRMVDKFSKGHCFVIGDSAHIHSPAGGQGMNSAVQDAMNIAWKLSAVLQGNASQSLLETYTIERLPVIAAMLDKTKLIHTANFKDNAMHDEKSIAWRRDGEILMLGINYRSSTIIVDTLHSEELLRQANPYQGGRVLCAGDRAPQAPSLMNKDGQETSLFDIFGYTQHTLLTFSSDGITEEVMEVISMTSTRNAVKPVIILPTTNSSAFVEVENVLVLHDREGHAVKAYFGEEPLGGMKLVIVRPDMYVGAMVKKLDELKYYFWEDFRVIVV